MTATFADLPSRSLVRITGPDWRVFLQGLISNDVETLEPGRVRFAADDEQVEQQPTLGREQAGEVLSGQDGAAMALLRLDRIEGAELTVQDRPVKVLKPGWMA